MTFLQGASNLVCNLPNGAIFDGLVPDGLRRRLAVVRRSIKADVKSLDAIVAENGDYKVNRPIQNTQYQAGMTILKDTATTHH